ncbi:DUF4097 family beta strand repeat-containing protein [Aliikangiella sp. IMCC44653]
MKHTTNSKLITGLLFLAMLFSLPAYSETEQISKSLKVSAGGKLELDSDNGAIQIKTWDKSEAKIEITKRARSKDSLEDFKVSIDQSGNTIVINGDGGWNSRVSVEFEVTVPQQFNLDLKTGGGSIEVDDISGQLKLRTSGGSISVGDMQSGSVNADTSGGSIKVGDINGDLQVTTSGGSIKLGKITGIAKADTSGGSIKVESGGKELKADTSGGSIKVGPSKGNVDVETSGGSIKIDMTEGNVKASTSGGSVKIEGSKGSVVAETSGGSIKVGESGGPVKAETGGGSIVIQNAKGFIEAYTAGGSITAEMVEKDNSKDTHVDLKTAGGSITLYLPKSVQATVSATLRITRNAHRDYRIYSDFPLSIKGENSDKVTANGKLNGGGDKIDLKTTNGDIYIKYLED